MKTLHFIYKKTSSAFLEFLCTSLHLGPYNSNCIMKWSLNFIYITIKSLNVEKRKGGGFFFGSLRSLQFLRIVRMILECFRKNNNVKIRFLRAKDTFFMTAKYYNRWKLQTVTLKLQCHRWWCPFFENKFEVLGRTRPA